MIETYDVLNSKFDICFLHLKRMQQGFENIKHLRPLTAASLENILDKDVAFLELFTSRFAKLQDYMGEKLFPAVVNILANTHESLSYIDTLNVLEKNSILESATKWRDLRDLRNKISHEYPNSYMQQCETLNKIMDSFSYLETTLNTIKAQLEKYERTS